MTDFDREDAQRLLAIFRERINKQIDADRPGFEAMWDAVCAACSGKSSDLIIALMARLIDSLAELGMDPGFVIGALAARHGNVVLDIGVRDRAKSEAH